MSITLFSKLENEKSDDRTELKNGKSNDRTELKKVTANFQALILIPAGPACVSWMA